MCGIAGYNVSGELCEEHLSDKMEKVLQEAWFHNVHRGWDAAGYFTVDLKKEIQVFKRAGVAPQIFQDEILDKGLILPSTTLAAHTRAPSSGAGNSKDNSNNHPVGWGGVWTTHNGTLYNDDEIKKDLTATNKEYKNLPEVDTLALSMMLAQTKPTKFDEVLEAMSEIRGSFSIHSIWDDFANVSLFARSSTSNPFVMCMSTRSEGIFYGSEKDSIYGMMHMAGLDPNDKEEWEWRTLDPGAAILVQNGGIVDWGTFDAKSAWSYGGYDSSTNYTMHRWLPKEGSRKRMQVYSTDRHGDYINKARKPSFVGTEKGTVLYTREKGFTEDAEGEGFPYTKGEMEWGAVFAEADEIRKDGDLLHVFYGDIELVTTSSGRIVRDVFNHSLFGKSQRWTKTNKKNARSLVNIDKTWEDFFKASTTFVSQIPGSLADYEYVKEMELARSKKVSELAIHRQKKSGLINTDGTDIDTSQYRRMKPTQLITWNNINQFVVEHEVHPTLKFLADGECPTHNQPFKTHDQAFQCRLLLSASSFFMAAFDHVELHQVWYNGTRSDAGAPGTVIYQMPTDYHACELESKSTGFGKDPCYWALTREVRVIDEPTETYWTIPIAEECVVCSLVRELEILPAWMQLLTIDEKEVEYAS